MHAFPIETFLAREFEQRLDNIGAELDCTRVSGDSKMTAATRDLDAEPVFDLSQVFVELAAKIGQAFIVGRFQDDVPGNVNSTQV